MFRFQFPKTLEIQLFSFVSLCFERIISINRDIYHLYGYSWWQTRFTFTFFLTVCRIHTRAENYTLHRLRKQVIFSKFVADGGRNIECYADRCHSAHLYNIKCTVTLLSLMSICFKTIVSIWHTNFIRDAKLWHVLLIKWDPLNWILFMWAFNQNLLFPVVVILSLVQYLHFMVWKCKSLQYLSALTHIYICQFMCLKLK